MKRRLFEVQAGCGRVLASLLVAVSLTSVVTSEARADFEVVGNPWPANSWVQSFIQDSSRGPFTGITARMLSDDAFEIPGMKSFTVSGWAVDLEQSTPTLIVASGGALTTLGFEVWFEGDLADPLSFQFDAWNGELQVESALAEWDGSKWTMTQLIGSTVRPVIPEPTTVLAGLLLLIPFGASTVRILNRRTR